ncbi:MAG TPA: hypothetical protein VHG70_00690 [Nocardioidaceae bacterium]|nr:hypothetical protein [Nocardioidaceae bacterium]
MIRRLVSAAIVALVLALACSTGAYAATVSIIDARQDMWALTEDPRVRAPGQQLGDIRRTTIVHGPRAVSMRISFVELRRAGEWYTFDAELRTNAGTWLFVTVWPYRQHWRGELDVSRRNCGVTRRVDYGQDVLKLRIPRTCLNGPRWVQARVTSLHQRSSDLTVFGDSAHSVGPRASWSSRVRRG